MDATESFHRCVTSLIVAHLPAQYVEVSNNDNILCGQYDFMAIVTEL